MIKKIVLIDNDDINETLDDITTTVNEDDNLEFTVDGIWFNPVGRKYMTEENHDLNQALIDLENEILNNSIDVIGCDFNLHNTDKILMFKIVEKIREKNKNCSLFIYSGGLNKSLLKIFEESGERTGESLFRLILSCNVDKFVPGRAEMLKDTCIELLKNPSVPLFFEKNLLELSSMKLYPELGESKLTFEDIAKSIRIDEVQAIDYIKEIFLRGMTNIVKNNEILNK